MPSISHQEILNLREAPTSIWKMPLNILIIEDNEADVDLISYHLQKLKIDQAVDSVQTKNELLEALEKFDPDIILSDYNLPDFNGLEALEICLSQRPQVPFVFVTGTLGETLAVETLKRGASDFILKENLVQLPGAVLRSLREASQKIANVEMAKALKESDLSNRALIENAPEAIIVYDPEEKRICDFNQKACQLLGCTNVELLNTDFESLCHSQESGSSSVSFQTRINQVMKGNIATFEGTVGGSCNDRYEIRMLRFPFMGKSLIRTSIADLSIERKAEKAYLQGQQQERQRMAREIHDGIGQMLVAAKYRLAAVENSPAKNIQDQLLPIEELLEHIIQEARRISDNLSPRVLEELGLEEALKDLFKQIEQAGNLAIKSDFDPQKFSQMSPNVNLTVYRIIQEALNNVIKYAQASEVTITFNKVTGNQLHLCIADNGKGFDPNLNGHAGNGIRNMNYRVMMLNGLFRLLSEPHKGTAISVQVPIN